MTLERLTQTISTPLIFDYEVARYFSNEPKTSINTQLSRMAARGALISLKRGVYAFPQRIVDVFVVANKLYEPSYISLESALNYYGIIPDVPAVVTSVTTITTKRLNNTYGVFLYSKLNKRLYNPYQIVRVKDANSDFYYKIASAEKALLDFIYIRHVKDLASFRIDLVALSDEGILNLGSLTVLSNSFPQWVQKVLDD